MYNINIRSEKINILILVNMFLKCQYTVGLTHHLIFQYLVTFTYLIMFQYAVGLIRT
jgi:hypothetical protein